MTPLYMLNRTLGGASPDAFTPAVPEGANGLYNVGLLVCSTGLVTGYAPMALELYGFYMSDGSSVIDNPSGEPSVFVDCQWIGSLPDIGSYVRVTGTSGAGVYDGKPMRVLTPHYQSDIVVVE